MNEQILNSIFKRDDLRGVVPAEFNPAAAAAAAIAFTRLLPAPGGGAIAVGGDARESTPVLKTAIISALLKNGCRVDDFGLCSSEEIYYACGACGDRYAGGIMVTASHNPREYNGMKFLFSGALPLSGEEMAEMRRLMAAMPLEGSPAGETAAADPAGLPGYRQCSLRAKMADFLLSHAAFDRSAAAPQRRLKIVIGAGHGVGAVAFQEIARRLSPLGFDFLYLDAEPDGTFHHGMPNPLLPQFMQRIGDCVRANHADLGIGFDGDADRAGFVDEQGNEIIPAQVYSLVAQCKLSALPPGHARPLLMRNICCSRLIPDCFQDCCEIIDTPVGHGIIKKLMRHPAFRDRVLFAGEHSGHYFYPEFHYVDSGALTSLYMLRQLSQITADGQSLSEKLAPWRQRYCWSGELNYALPSRQELFTAMSRICRDWQGRPGVLLQSIATDARLGLPVVSTLTGTYSPEQAPFPDLKVSCRESDDCSWWFVVRPSGNEPKLRLNVEVCGSNCVERCRLLVEQLKLNQ